jgi:lipoate synthase
LPIDLAAEAEEEDKHAEQDKYAEEDEAEEAVHEAEEDAGAAHEVDAVQILEQANPLCLVCVLVPDGPGQMPKQHILDGNRAQMAWIVREAKRVQWKYQLQLPIRDRDK